MARRIKPQDLEITIGEELTLYHKDVVEAIDKASKKAASKLVKKTRATAPKGKRGSYRKNIASKLLKKNRNGSTYAWYVKAPDYRLTHLLVHGHATRDGGRTRADPFLHNAIKQVIPEYEKSIEEALKNGK